MKKHLKILILEDSVSDAEIIQFELRKAKIKFEAKVVFTRRTFIKELKSFDPGIILADFSLPNFDGLSALKIVRRRGILVPFIFVSGTIGEERATEALKKGATDYVMKNHISGLAPKIKRSLNEFKINKEKVLAEKRLAEAQRVARIGNWEFNMVSKKTSWSNEIFHILGYNTCKVTPNEKHFYTVLHPEDRNLVLKNIRNAITKRKEMDCSCRIIHYESQELRYINVKAKFRDNKGKKADKVFGIIQDITELKNAQIKLENINHELKTFIYRASHDIRGPLSSSIGVCNLAQKEYEKFPDVLKYFEMINNRMQNLDEIVCSLIEAMSIKDSFDKIEKINFKDLLNEIFIRLGYLDEYKRINIKINVSSTNFYSVHTYLYTIFKNILENAIKYQNINISDPQVTITINQNENGVVINFMDNGIGVNEKIKDKIFDMFYRGSLQSKGTGLGLYIVKNAVDRLKGTISLNSSIKKGSNFQLFLPHLYMDDTNTFE